MALKVQQQIESSGYKGVADADQIAYSYKTENGIEVMDKTVKDKLDEGEMFDQNTTLREKVLEMLDSEHYAQSYAEDAEDAADRAEAAAINAESQKDLVDSIASEKVAALDAKANQVEANYQSQIQQINDIHTAINEFKTSFEVDKDFAVVSQQEYNNSTKNPGTIYFIY